MRTKVGFTITVKNKLGNDARYDIPEDVYYYIKSLEGFVRDPLSSSLKQEYAKRFLPLDQRYRKGR